MNEHNIRDNTAKHLGTAIIFTIVTVIAFGLIYPLVMTVLSQLLFPKQAAGSMLYVGGKPIGSAIIGQLWTKPQYFHGRPSAAGKGYDPTSTGATGIDPDISPEAAYYQAARVAKARNLPLAQVRTLIEQHTSGRTLAMLGEPRVNVLELNLALDGKVASETAPK